MAKYIPFIDEPYFKCNLKYYISYLSFFILFSSLVIVILVTIPDIPNSGIIKMSFIFSSLFISILISRICCTCCNEEKEEIRHLSDTDYGLYN